MNHFGKLLLNDVRHISRDVTLIFVLLMPVLFIALLRYAIPVLNELLPSLPTYYATILAFMCLMISIVPAFLIAFLMLDEKDEQVWKALQVLPLSPAVFLVYRMGLITTIGFLFSLLALLLAPLLPIALWQAFALSLMSAASAPIAALTIVAFADNKIEGITAFKIINMLLFLPALFVFFPTHWFYLLGCIPVFWTYRLFAATTEPSSFVLLLGAGIVAHAVYFVLIYRVFRNRSYR